MLTYFVRGMQDCFREHPDVYGDELTNPGPDPEDTDETETGISEAVDSAIESIAEDAPISTTPSTVSPPSSSTLSPESSKNPAESRQERHPSTITNPAPLDADRHPAHTSDKDDRIKPDQVRSAADQVKRKPVDLGEGDDELVPKEWHDARKMNEGK